MRHQEMINIAFTAVLNPLFYSYHLYKNHPFKLWLYFIFRNNNWRPGRIKSHSLTVQMVESDVESFEVEEIRNKRITKKGRFTHWSIKHL
jgi:hypothetical protein